MMGKMTKAESIAFSQRIWGQLDDAEWRTARSAFESAFPFERWDSRSRRRVYDALRLGEAMGVVECKEVPCGMRKYVRWRRCRWPRWT